MLGEINSDFRLRTFKPPRTDVIMPKWRKKKWCENLGRNFTCQMILIQSLVVIKMTFYAHTDIFSTRLFIYLFFKFNFIYTVFVLKIGKPRLHQTVFSVPPPSARNSTRKLVEELVSFSFFLWVWQLRSPSDQKAIGGCQLLALRFPWVIIAASACTRYMFNSCKNSERFSKMSRQKQQQSTAAGTPAANLLIRLPCACR